MGLWSSGYDTALTQQRSGVRISSGPSIRVPSGPLMNSMQPLKKTDAPVVQSVKIRASQTNPFLKRESFCIPKRKLGEKERAFDPGSNPGWRIYLIDFALLQSSSKYLPICVANTP